MMMCRAESNVCGPSSDVFAVAETSRIGPMLSMDHGNEKRDKKKQQQQQQINSKNSMRIILINSFMKVLIDASRNSLGKGLRRLAS